VSAIITLTTDFGSRDPYVAEMKGVILSLARAVHLVDVTHEIEPQHITEGALAVEATAQVFPPGTIHVAVVDPGVGTARRGLVVESKGQYFVGPDNGILTPVLAAGAWEAFALEATELGRAQVSRTFHGRDVFAPAAAHLALGVTPSRFGPPVTDPVLLTWPTARPVAGGVTGHVIHVDRFGNLVTSITAAQVEVITQGTLPRGLVGVGGRRLPLVGTYGDLLPGGLGALVGSRNRLEVVVREGSAAARLRANRGTPVLLRRTARGKASRGRW
jgi:S-adenosylmethionine hydrolase